MQIVQISDTHFGTEQAPVEQALIRALEDDPPDTILLTGDVTQRARRYQFDRAKAFFDKLPRHDFIAIPGNHDLPLYHLWRRLLMPYQGFQRVFDEVEVTRVTDAYTIIAINSTRRTKHKDGVFSERKIERVAQELENNRHSHLRIVAAHHPVAAILPKDHENLVANAEEAVRRWSAAGVDLILGGHIHYPFMAPLKGHYPNVDTCAWIMQAGTALSHRVRNEKPNSFNRIIVDGDRASARIEQWNFAWDQNAFERVESFTPWAQV